MLKGTCIGFLEDAGCGLIYADQAINGSRIVFVHFRDIELKNGRQDLNRGERVEYVLDPVLGRKFYRDFAASGENGGFVRRLEEEQSKEDLPILLKTPEGGWEPSKTGDVIFYQCRWDKKANFSSCYIQGDLVFLGCSFADYFTLKEAKVTGSVHMEGCDFSGAGGASFRGLRARALYLDFGVKGPSDMVWLNEMCIDGNVVIGGDFKGEIQVMRVQDNRVSTSTAMKNDKMGRACFQNLYIGKEFYKSQNINRSFLHAGLDIQGLSNSECIDIEGVEVGFINAKELSGNVCIRCRSCKVLGSIAITGKGDGNLSDIDLSDSYIEGHVDIKNVCVKESINLDDATIERLIRLHSVCFQVGGGLKLARMSVNRFVMDDFYALYGLKKGETLSKWKNPKFGMLWREGKLSNLNQGCDMELLQEYVLLKNLLSQEGQLRLEDEAFYNMRKLGHWYQDMGMLVFNYIFGWGVRLQNILVSSAVFIVLYACVYKGMFSLPVMHAVQLSLQSMFMAFFGEMNPKVMAASQLSWWVLSESVLGIVLVTVFVGAYVRKLLR